MKQKKALSVTALVLALFFILGGQVLAGPQKETGATAEKPYEILWYHIGTPQGDVDKVMAHISEYTKEKINVTVRMEMIGWGDYNEKMKVIVAAGESFDICFTASWALNYLEFAQQGAFYDLTDYVDQHGAELKAAINPLYLQGARIDGRLYAIPNNKDLVAKMTWTFNKRLLDKHNLSVEGVYSMESLEPLLKVIAANEPDIHAFVPYGLKGILPYDFVLGTNIPVVMRVDEQDSRVRNLVDEPLYTDLVKTSRDFFEKGYIKPDYNFKMQFGQTGKYFVGKRQAWPLEIMDPMTSRSEKDPVKSVWCSEARVTTDSVLGALLAVSATSDNPRKAFEFLALLNTDPWLRNAVDSGIEGEHYIMTEGRQRDLDAASRYNMPSFSLGNLLLLNISEDEPANKWQLMKELNESGIPSPAFGFVPDLQPIQNEIAAVRNVWNEFNDVLEFGKVDPLVYLPKAREKLNAAGLEKIINEVQTQFDAWKAANN